MDRSISEADKEVSAFLTIQMRLHGITQADLQKKIGRSQGYISERLLCKRSWALSELDRIAPLFHQQDALDLALAAHRYHLHDYSPIFSDRDTWGIAAMESKNKSHYINGDAEGQDEDDGDI